MNERIAPAERETNPENGAALDREFSRLNGTRVESRYAYERYDLAVTLLENHRRPLRYVKISQGIRHERSATVVDLALVARISDTGIGDALSEREQTDLVEILRSIPDQFGGLRGPDPKPDNVWLNQ